MLEFDAALARRENMLTGIVVSIVVVASLKE